MKRSTTTIRPVIRSTFDPRMPRPKRHVYARLIDIEARARAGEKFSDPKPPKVTTVNIGTPEKRHYPQLIKEPHRGPRSDGERLADTLLNCESPLGTQIPADNADDRELKNAQQSGTRWLRRKGYPEWRLSYRRVNNQVVWILTPRKVKETS